MKTLFSLSKLVSLFAVAGLLSFSVLAGGCASTSTSTSTGEYVDDAVITTKVKSALLRNDDVKSFDVSVQTVLGIVQLSGFVDTNKQKSAAGEVTATVKGVREVRNNLIVK